MHHKDRKDYVRKLVHLCMQACIQSALASSCEIDELHLLVVHNAGTPCWHLQSMWLGGLLTVTTQLLCRQDPECGERRGGQELSSEVQEKDLQGMHLSVVKLPGGLFRLWGCSSGVVGDLHWLRGLGAGAVGAELGVLVFIWCRCRALACQRGHELAAQGVCGLRKAVPQVCGHLHRLAAREYFHVLVSSTLRGRHQQLVCCCSMCHMLG